MILKPHSNEIKEISSLISKKIKKKDLISTQIPKYSDKYFIDDVILDDILSLELRFEK